LSGFLAAVLKAGDYEKGEYLMPEVTIRRVQLNDVDRVTEIEAICFL